MNARAMTDEQLQAWRAQRTGKPVKLDDSLSNPGVLTNAGGDPTAGERGRHPLEDLEGKFDPNNIVPNDPAPALVANNQTPDEVEALRQQLAAANGRLGPTQRQTEELRAALQAAQQQIADLQAQTNARAAEEAKDRARKAAMEIDPFEGLTQEQKDLLDPTALALIEQTARNVYAKATSNFKDPEALISQVLAQRDAAKRDTFIRSVGADLRLTELSADNKFKTFLEQDDSAGLLLNSFVSSKDIETARYLEPKVRQMLKRFEKSTNTTRTPDPQDRASAHLARSAGGQAGGTQGTGATLTPDQVKSEMARARALARAGKHKEVNAIFASINN